MIYYIGIRESDIVDTEIFDGGSITYFGSNKNGNRSLNGKLKMAINHNKPETDATFNEFVKGCVADIQKKDKDAKFYYYNQHFLHLQKPLFDFEAICGNKKELIDKLNSKFYTREYLKGAVKLIDHKLMEGKDISLLNIKKKLGGGSNFVVQQCVGNGGEGTFIFNSKTENEVLKMIKPENKYHVSKFITGNSVNTHVVIGKDKILVFPSSIQIIKPKNDNLCYIGGDYSAYNNYTSKEIDKKVRKYALNAAKKIRKLGYIGVLGVDFIATKDEVYFMEINPRFQTSSAMLNTNLKAHGLPSLHKLNLDAFLGNKLMDIPEFKAEGAFMVRSHNDGYEFSVKPVKVYTDGNKSSEKIENGTYTKTEIFDRAITDDENAYDVDETFKLKLRLMQDGVCIEEKTMQALAGALYDDYVTCSGVMLKIGGNHSVIGSKNLNDVYLNNREYVTASINKKSKYVLTTNGEGDFLLKDKSGKVVSDDIGISRPMLGQKESSCVAIHGDRIRVSLITGCSGDCRFCGLNKLQYTENNFEDIKTEIDKILKLKKGVTRLFITGGNPKESYLEETLKVVEKLVKEYTPRGIVKYDFMFAPRGIKKYFYEKDQSGEYKKFLKKLKSIGVTTVAVDMEMYNSELMAKYAPFKNKIGRENYLDTLAQAVQIFGEGCTRSNIIVGIEPLKDTIEAVKKLTAVGAQPCLSPYEPYKQLPEIKKPTWKFLYEAYVQTDEICQMTKVNMAPSIYATDTHNSVASARKISLTQTELDAFYSNVYDVQESVKKELKSKSK